MSNVIDIQQFLVGKSFYIPAYQRDYAWTTSQVDDLFSDIQEALESGSGHYLGTLVLAKNGGQSYEVVDGQQRISTLALIIDALLQQLDAAEPDRIANEAILLRNGSALKLHFGKNAAFVDSLLASAAPTPTSVGQRKLVAACEFSRERAKTLATLGGAALVKRWLDTIKSLEIIQFIAADAGRAIRMFQTVNDRGVPLTALDKAKALLVYYSNRHLAGALDGDINAVFGDCFAVFDTLREFVKEPGYRIDNIARDSFTEDDLLRYHYLAYTYPSAVNASDYDGTVRTVFDGFLKGTLKELSTEPNNLRQFIRDYTSDLRSFAQAFRSIICATNGDRRLYKLFVILGLSARLYPLAIRLYERGLLHCQVSGTSVDLLHCLEVCDVRVYKTRRTDPAKDIGDLSHGSRSASAHDIASGLRDFTARFMSDGMFQASLAQDMYRNGALLLFLIRHDEDVAGSTYQQPTLVKMVVDQITREHIMAQTPNWAVSSQGFKDDTDFEAHRDMFGNLTLLSKSDNSRCLNEPTHTKLSNQDLYARSMYAGTRQLAHRYHPSGGIFVKADILSRTQELISSVMREWEIW